MINCSPNIQLQLSEAVTLIANTDFPSNWSNLLPDLISLLSLENLNVNIGVLQTAHSIFKRWRSQFENNELFTEINYVMATFAPAYLQFFIAIDQLILTDQNPLLLDILLLLVKIFASLVCQDLPEFVEDNLLNFMGFFKNYLAWPTGGDSDDEPGVVQKVKSCICEIIDLFARKVGNYIL